MSEETLSGSTPENADDGKPDRDEPVHGHDHEMDETDGMEAGMPIGTEDLARHYYAFFARRAWVHLGKIAPARGDDAKEDPALAKFTIDLLGAMLPVLSRRLGEDVARELQRELTQLRLNFVSVAAPGQAGANG